MTPSSCFLIINPTSGHFSNDALRKIASSLRQGGLSPEILMTRSSADAPLFAARLCSEHNDPLIVAGGGDGTINGVVNGLVPGKATLGILPLGTSNVLARELGLKTIDRAVEAIIARRTRSLSVGIIEGEAGKKYFLLMAGIGLDGEVVARVRLGEKKWLKQGAYVLAGLRSIFSWDLGRINLKTEKSATDCHSVILCNARKYGGDFILSPDADLFAPGLAGICVKDPSRTTYFKLLAGLVAGKQVENESISRFSANVVEIEGNKPVQIDGDFYGYSPVTIRSLPDFLKIIV